MRYVKPQSIDWEWDEYHTIIETETYKIVKRKLEVNTEYTIKLNNVYFRNGDEKYIIEEPVTVILNDKEWERLKNQLPPINKSLKLAFAFYPKHTTIELANSDKKYHQRENKRMIEWEINI